MKISTQEIRAALELILNDFEAHGATVWNVPEDYYWDVPLSARYDSYEEPKQLQMGRLSDDLVRIQRIASGQEHSVPQALVWLSSILKLAGEKGPIELTRHTKARTQ